METGAIRGDSHIAGSDLRRGRRKGRDRPGGKGGQPATEAPTPTDGPNGPDGPEATDGPHGPGGPMATGGLAGTGEPEETDGPHGPGGPEATDGPHGPGGPMATDGLAGKGEPEETDGPHGPDGPEATGGPSGPGGPMATGGLAGTSGSADTGGLPRAVDPVAAAAVSIPEGDGDGTLPNGNAPHATLPVRPTDRVVRAGCYALAGLWWLTGLRRAAGALRHYLAGTGTPYALDASTLVALPPVRAAVNARLTESEAGHWSGTDSWHGVRIGPFTSPDWWLAVRGIQFRVVRPNPHYYRVEFRKSWDFDRGETEAGVPFTAFARLHETGLAREFTATGGTGYLPR